MTHAQRNILIGLLAFALLLGAWKILTSSSPNSSNSSAAMGNTAGGSAGLTSSDKDSIASAVVAELAKRQIIGPTQCANFFEYGSATVSDYSLSGNEGRAIVDVPLTAKSNIGKSQQFQSLKQCYGDPGRDLIGGLKFTSTFEIGFQRWDNGVRIIVPIYDARSVTVTEVPPPVPQMTFTFTNSGEKQVWEITARPNGTSEWREKCCMVDKGGSVTVSLDNPDNACVWDVKFGYRYFDRNANQHPLEHEFDAVDLCKNPQVTVTVADTPEPGDSYSNASAQKSCPAFSTQPQECVIYNGGVAYGGPGLPAGAFTCYAAKSGSIAQVSIMRTDGEFPDPNMSRILRRGEGYLWKAGNAPLVVRYKISMTRCKGAF